MRGFIPIRNQWCFVLLAATACLATGWDTPSKMREAPTWQERRDALHAVIKAYPATAPAFQQGVVKLFERETADPHWEELAEDTNYDDYYEEVSNLNQQVAASTNDSEAWRSLVYSAYNPSSRFGKWLIMQPQTFPFFWEMLHSQNSWTSGHGAQMLAEMITYCGEPGKRTCSPKFRTNQSEILGYIRRQVESSEEPSQVILALETCGFPADIAILEKRAAALQSVKISATDKLALSERDSCLWLIRQAEQQIRQRFKAAS